MKKTAIEWCDHSWNPVTGCPGPKISAGCANCYAERNAKRFRGRFGYDADDPFGIHVHNDRWLQPLRKRAPSRIFVCSMGDLFHKSVSDQHIAKAFTAAAMCPQHTFIFLTKRPARLVDFVSDTSTRANDMRGIAYQELAVEAGRDRNMDGLRWPLRNVLLMATVCNQDEADRLIPELFSASGAWRFGVSIEPMLGPVSLKAIPLPHFGSTAEKNALTGEVWIPGNCGESSQTLQGKKLDWVICGGETGPGARPMHPDWVRGLRDQCQEAGTPFFFKGWGGWMPSEINSCGRIGTWFNGQFVDNHGNIQEPGLNMSRAKSKVYGHRLLDGREWNEVPA